MNRGPNNFSLAVNHLADKTQGEIKLMLGLKKTPGFHGGRMYQMPVKSESGAVKGKKNVPDQWDWRIEGAVTQVGRAFVERTSCAPYLNPLVLIPV